MQVKLQCLVRVRTRVRQIQSVLFKDNSGKLCMFLMIEGMMVKQFEL
jgi:hypothetical protein